MNTQVQKIYTEIERRIELLKKLKNNDFTDGSIDAYKGILILIDSLPEEPTPKGYDEAYLNECIAKASKTWEGVDVDKYVDEVRGNRPMNSDSLEEAAEECINEALFKWSYDDEDGIEQYVHDAFIAGAKWQAEQNDKDLSEKIAAAYQLGLANKEEQMMKEAVEGTVMDFSSNRPRPQVDVLLDPHKYHTGEKVRIIIVKEDER